MHIYMYLFIDLYLYDTCLSFFVLPLTPPFLPQTCTKKRVQLSALPQSLSRCDQRWPSSLFCRRASALLCTHRKQVQRKRSHIFLSTRGP